MSKKMLIIGILIVLIFSTIIPISIGNNLKMLVEDELQFNKTSFIDQMSNVWPLHKNDPQLTGRSIYDTSQNKGGEKWKYLVDHCLENTIVIDKEEVLYTTSWDGDLHAVYPNGTMKWKKDLSGWDAGAPAIGYDGTIYAGTENKFYAFYPNGTQRWILNLKCRSFCDPVIDNNGTIYVSTKNSSVYAIYPNGTIKWEYNINGPFIGASAIDHNGNVYFTDRNKFLYCLNNNGSFKWRYRKVNIRNDPVVSDDGTIYVVSSGLNALYPNGTLKWYIDYAPQEWYGYPSITHDGKIILSGSGNYITALNPSDGSVIWQYKIGDLIMDVSTAVIAGDGSIYFAYTAYSDDVAFLCALNSDGSLKWETYLNTDIKPDYVYIFADPSIGSDGIVYIPTSFGRGGSNLTSFGYINAIGKDNAVVPEPPIIIGPSHVRRFINYEFTLKCSLPAGENVYYLVDWDDQLDYFIYSNNWIGPYSSEEEVKLYHFWDVWGVRTSNIKVMVRGDDNLCSPCSYLNVTISRNRANLDYGWLRFFDMFPILLKILNHIL